MGTHMRLLNFANFEMPALFARIEPRGIQPPKVNPGDTRHVDALVNRPLFGVYDPNSLHFPEAMKPVVPGNPNVTMGFGMIEYDHQPQWDRSAVDLAGPVRQFFQGVLFDNRLKHL
jgi:hypothetical protein